MPINCLRYEEDSQEKFYGVVKHDKWDPARTTETERRLSLRAHVHWHEDLEMASGQSL